MNLIWENLVKYILDQFAKIKSEKISELRETYRKYPASDMFFRSIISIGQIYCKLL